MSGIKDLAVLIHWMDNDKQSTLEASLFKKRKVPRERQLILNDLKEEANRATNQTHHQPMGLTGHFAKERAKS